jgi:hypothetical protein
MRFLAKKDAIARFSKIKNQEFRLFEEDINSSGSKCFHVDLPENIYTKMNDKNNKQCNFYEFWTRDMPLYFSLDLDIKTLDKKVETYEQSIEIVKSNILKVINGFSKFYEYKCNLCDVIVLESDSRFKEIDKTNKFSYHVIFRGIYFENYIVLRDFYKRLMKEYKLEYSDISIYRETCLRLCYNSKFGKKSILLPIELDIQGRKTKVVINEETNNNTSGIKFFKETMITDIRIGDKKITSDQIYYKTNKKEYIEKKESMDNIKNINIKEILYKLPSYYYDNYNYWIKIGMILKNIDDNLFDLWDRWSSQSNKYKNQETKDKWKTFTKDGKINIGTLIHWAKKEKIDNIFIKKNMETIINEYPEKPIIINFENNTILDQAKLEPQIFEKYIDKKLLFVQSEKGTGKTSNLFECLFDENNPKIGIDDKVLFLSSKRTFGVKLYGDLKHKGFKLYSEIKENEIVEKKIICQIDSLLRLSYDEYDLIIIDEAESMARYLSSQHFIKNVKAGRIKEELDYYLKNANQVIVMDADLSDRCVNYYRSVTRIKKEDTHLILNKFTPYQDYEIVSMFYDDWVKNILTDIQDKNRIVIAMASNNKAKDLKILLEQDNQELRILLIHKETPDNEKMNYLNNVNEKWQEFDIIIYTPSVCMGVSFDIPNYFTRIYGYGCEKSLGAQEFTQMLHRVREPIEKNIYISLDKYEEFKPDNDLMTYQMIEEILCSDYYLTYYNLDDNTISKKKDKIENLESNKMEKRLVYPYKDEPVYDMYVRNAWETIENKLNFSACFYGYIKYKKYKTSCLIHQEKSDNIKMTLKEIKTTREVKEKDLMIEGIINAQDISKDDFLIKIKQRDEYLEDKDKYEIKRYNFKACYDLEIENMTKEIIENFYNEKMMKWYSNLKTILKTETQETLEKLEILKNVIIADKWVNNCYLDFIKKNKYINHYFAITIIDITEFDINNLEIKQEIEKFQDNLSRTIEYCEIHKQEISYKYDLKQYNKNLLIQNNREKLKFINTIITSQYGYIIKLENSFYRMKDNNIWDNLPRENKIIPKELKIYSEELPTINVVDMFNDE